VSQKNIAFNLERSVILLRTLDTFVTITKLRELSSVLNCRRLNISNFLLVSEKGTKKSGKEMKGKILKKERRRRVTSSSYQ